MLRFFGLKRPDVAKLALPPPPAPPTNPRVGSSYEDKKVTYARFGEPEAEHRVTVVYVASGESGDARWRKLAPEKFVAVQEKLPFGAIHPRCQAVLDVMRPVPAGARVHPDRNRLATGTTVSALLGSNRWIDRDARSEGYATAADLLVARATGLARGVQSNADMQRGVNEESEALDLVERLLGLQLARHKPMGLLVHPGNELGSSPDGICARVPCLVEIKSKRAKTDLAMPIDHYWQVQCQMLSTADTNGIPRITNVLYVQYVSHPPRGHPVLSVRMVQFDPDHGTRLLVCAHEHVKRLRAAGVPSIAPWGGGGAVPPPARDTASAGVHRGGRGGGAAASPSPRARRRYVPYWPPSRKLMKRLRVHKA